MNNLADLANTNPSLPAVGVAGRGISSPPLTRRTFADAVAVAVGLVAMTPKQSRARPLGRARFPPKH